MKRSVPWSKTAALALAQDFFTPSSQITVPPPEVACPTTWCQLLSYPVVAAEGQLSQPPDLRREVCTVPSVLRRRLMLSPRLKISDPLLSTLPAPFTLIQAEMVQLGTSRKLG